MKFLFGTFLFVLLMPLEIVACLLRTILGIRAENSLLYKVWDKYLRV